MTDPRPDPDSEVAGESEYGNDTGFATSATAGPGTGSDAEPAAAEDAGEEDPGRGAD